MKASNLFKVFSTVIVAGSLVACSIKAGSGGGSGGGSPGLPPFTHKVAGPNLDGKWESGCVQDAFGRNAMFRLVFNGQAVEREKFAYNDSQCTQLDTDPMKTYKVSGSFRYSEAYSSGVYEVEYRYVYKNGGTSSNGENIRTDGSRLWITDHYTGSGVYPDIELILVP